MAGNELKAVITVDAANATFTIEKFVQSTTGGMGQAATASKGAASAFSGLGGAALAINQAFELTQRVVGAVVGVLRDVIGAGSEFEKQIGAVSTLLIGDTSTSIEKIQSDLLGLDDRLGSSADLTAALYQALSAGVEAGKGVAFVGEAAKLASAGLGDLSGTVDLLTTVLNAYGLEAEDSKAVSEVLFEAVKKGKTTIEEISGSMGRVIPTAKNLGVGIGDLSAVIAKLTTVGLSTDIAVTSLNAALVAIQSPGADAEKVAKALGISFDDLRKTIREQGLVAGLQQLQEATGGNTQVIAKLIPSVEAQRAAFALLGTDMDELNGYMADFNAEAASGTQVAEAFDARAKTLDGSINALGVSAEKAKVSLLEGIRDPLISIIEKSRENVDAISDWMRANRDVINSGFDTWISGLKIVMDDLAPAVRAVADAMQWWSGSLDSTVGGINQQIRDTEAAMQDLISSNKFWWFESEATTKASKEYKNLETQLAGLQETLKQAQRAASSFGKSVDEGAGSVATAGAVAVDTGSQFDAMVATWKAGKVDLSKLGDEAEKTAKKLAESANRVAQLAGQSVQFAQSQLQQAAATGDLTRTTDAYVVAMDKAGAAYQAEIEASNAAAAAGASAAEVDGMRKEALEKLASAANQAATTQASAYQREEAAQSSLAHYLGQTTIAHDMEALAMANASEVAEAYSQTVVDIAAELARTTDEINKKRGVTLTAAEADKALAEANERAGQQISAAGKAATQASESLGELTRIASDFAKAVASGDWDAVGESIVASIVDATFTDHLENALNKTVVSTIKELTDPVGKAMEAVFEGVFDSLITSTGIKSALQSVGNSIVSGLSSIIGSGAPDLATAVSGATNNSQVLSAALSGGTAAGGSAVSGITSALGAAGAVGAVAAAGFGLFQIFASVFGGPSAKELMARRIKETLSDALTSDEVVSALNEAAAELGFGFSESMVGAIAGINTSITKTISAHIPIQIYPDIFFNTDEFNADVQALVADTGITEEFASQILSGGPVIGGAEGFFQLLFGIGPDQLNKETSRYLGDIAAAAGIAAADIEKVFGKERNATIESFGAGLANLGYQLGLTAEETQQMIEEFNAAIGAPQAAVLAFRELDDELRAELGTGDQYQSMMQSVTDRLRGLGVEIPKRVKSLGDLRDAFLQAGMPADQFAKLVKASMEDAGISVDQFGDDWASITAALVDPQVQGIDEVVADVQRLGGLSPLMDDLAKNFEDMFAAFAPGGFDSSELTVIGEQLSKLATLPPDALAGMSSQLHDLFVDIARANDLTLPQVAEMFQGQIPDAVLQSVMAVQGFGQELGLLTGQSNTSLREVEDDFRRLAGEILDSSGELTTFGETLNKQLQSGLSGLDQTIADEMSSAGQLSADTAEQIAYQLAEVLKLPPEQLSDSTKQAVEQLKADLMAALNLTSEQVDAMIAEAAKAPPPVPTGTTKALDDATTATDGLTTSTTDAAAATGTLTDEIDKLIAQGTSLGTAGASVTEALGLTPEAAAAVTNITAGLSTAASGATEMATAVQAVTESVSGSTDEFAALAKAAGMSSDQVRAAIQPIIGTADDGQSLTATQAALSGLATFLPAEMVPAFQQSFTDAQLSISAAHTTAGEFQSLLNSMAKNYDITVTTHYVTDGEPPDTGGGEGSDDGHAAGHWTVPGPQGAPYRTTVHGGEEVLSVEQSRDYRRAMRERALDGLAPADERGIPAASASEQRGAGDVSELAELLRRIDRSLSAAPVMRVDVASRDALRAASEAGVEHVLLRKGARGDMWVEGRYVRFRP